MNRLRTTAAVALSLSLGMVSVLNADVRTEQKTRFQLGGVLGRMVNMFGGRGAREGVTSTVALKGNRKATMSDTTGQIIDLTEEKIYDLDIKGKKYKVTTFAELRKQIEDARKQAEENARKEQPSQSTQKPADNGKKDPEYEIDFDIKNTNDKKTINGFDTHHAVVTVTVREKGKTLEQSGGMVMTTDLWLAPEIAAMKELRDFDLRYAQKMFGPMVNGASARDMATALALYPQMKPALDKMAAEGGKIQGTPIQTVMTMDAVASAEQAAENAKSKDSSNDSPSATVGGLLGGLARRGSRNSSESNASNNPNRSTFMTTTTELLKVTTDVGADAVAVPANFKLDK
jgi:hypothetical protein